jgi:hypothetical protein
MLQNFINLEMLIVFKNRTRKMGGGTYDNPPKEKHYIPYNMDNPWYVLSLHYKT